MNRDGRRHAPDVGLDDVVLDVAGEELEPEDRELRQHDAFSRDPGRAGRGRTPRCGRSRRGGGVRVDLVEVADLAAARSRKTGQEGLEDGVGHRAIVRARRARLRSSSGFSRIGGSFAQDLDPERQGARRCPHRLRGRQRTERSSRVAPCRPARPCRRGRTRRARSRRRVLHDPARGTRGRRRASMSSARARRPRSRRARRAVSCESPPKR